LHFFQSSFPPPDTGPARWRSAQPITLNGLTVRCGSDFPDWGMFGDYHPT